jgi:hypothetical protein
MATAELVLQFCVSQHQVKTPLGSIDAKHGRKATVGCDMVGVNIRALDRKIRPSQSGFNAGDAFRLTISKQIAAMTRTVASQPWTWFVAIITDWDWTA